jgi:two-component system OmpR family sensor kinase
VLSLTTVRRFRNWPLRWRLTFASASLTFFILLIFGAVVGNLMAERVRSDFNRDVEEAASHLVSRTRIVERPLSEPIVYSPDLADVSLPNDASARVVNVEGHVLDQAPNPGPSLGPINAGISSIGSLTVATEPVLGARSQVVGYIQYARSNSHVATTVTKLWLFIIAGVLGGTVFAVLAGLALVSRAMRPIAILTKAAREVATTRDPSRRIPEPTTQDEVGELTRSLQQMLAALDASQADREAAMQKQREFVADASHELRTPLTSVLANLELLEIQLENGGGMEEVEIVTSAVRSSQRMSRLVSDLLILARSDAGQNRPMADLDLAKVAENAAREIAPSLGDRRLDASACKSVWVHGNQDELHRLLLNLLDNAVRYSPPNARVSLSTREDPSSSAVVEVADSGPGVPPDMRERIFERFVRNSDGTDTNPTSGTGLGLAMVKAIATSHGGTITAGTSKQLGGASLVLTLPTAKGKGGRVDPLSVSSKEPTSPG